MCTRKCRNSTKLGKKGVGRNIPSANAAGATGAAVGARDRLLALGERGVFAGAVSLDAAKVRVAVTTLGHRSTLLHVQVSQVATRRLDHLSARRLGVVRVALAKSDTLSHLSMHQYRDNKQKESVKGGSKPAESRPRWQMAAACIVES